MKTLYIAPYFRKWEDLVLSSPLGLNVNVIPHKTSPGFMLVFESIEALQEVYPETDRPSIQSFEVPEDE